MSQALEVLQSFRDEAVENLTNLRTLEHGVFWTQKTDESLVLFFDDSEFIYIFVFGFFRAGMEQLDQISKNVLEHLGHLQFLLIEYKRTLI